jgi:glutaminyl-peptide cyclotransferase
VIPFRFALFAACLALSACAPPPQPEGIVDYTYQVLHTYPHDPTAFTQGLFYLNGVLYEGTGRYGQSSLRKVNLETGKVIQKQELAPQYSGGGIAAWQDRVVQLTYQNEKGFLYDIQSLEPKSEFAYNGEGWGLTTDGDRLIMSDGSARLRLINPARMQEISRILITDDAGPVPDLNELEWVKGKVYANIWKTDRIACIDLTTGKIAAWIDLRGIISFAERGNDPENVLNGIAYDAEHDRLFVTGKRWPKLFEIKLVARPKTQ